LLHGVLANKADMEELKYLLEKHYEVKIYNMEIGIGAPTSLYTNMVSQLNTLCNNIYKIDDLQDGFNFIAMSQGGLLARGYVEYCNKYPVMNLITLVSPHGGVFYKTDLADDFYEPSKQEELSISNYWRDPYRYDLYLTNSTYLAELNGEVNNMVLFDTKLTLDTLKNFVIVWSPNDEVVEPPESAKFSMYDVVEGELQLVDLIDSQLYQNDVLGLKTMNEENRLHIIETSCLHVQHREPECFDQLKDMFQRFLN